MTVSAVDWLVLLGTVVTLWSVFIVAVAVGFGFVLAALEGWGYAGQYFAGYIVEKSLSIDNLFVFVIIMTSFAVPREHQQRVLIFGIIASLCLRAAFIAVGAALLSALSFMFLIFGLVLVWTAFRLFTHRDSDPDVANSGLVRATRRFFPVTDNYDGGRLTTRLGRARAHPRVHRGQADLALGARPVARDARNQHPVSLAVIGGVLVLTTVARAHAGAVIGPAPQAADQEAPG